MKNFASKGKSLFCLGFLVISMFGSAIAQTFPGPGFTIIDNDRGNTLNSCSIVPVTGITTNVTVSSVTLTNFTHTYIGDTETSILTPDLDIFDLATPPVARPCNYNGTYTFSDSGTNFIDAVTTGCADAFDVPAGTYRTSDYGGGTINGTATSLATDFGTFTPAEANGNWRICVFDFANGDAGAVGSVSITFAAPTAAGISIRGRVVTPTGNPIKDIDLTLTDGNGNVRSTITSISGEYVFEDLPAGIIYTVTASGKRYTFNQPTQFFNGIEDFTGADFVGYPINPTKFTPRSSSFPNL